jgi:DNA polymerase I
VIATISELPFKTVWAYDSEFIAQPGEWPDVVCLAAHELKSGQTIRLWRDQLGPAPPYPTDESALFVCFVANAENSCHLALGWPLPKNILDLSPEFRRIVNGRTAPQGKGLLGALAYYGFDTIGSKRKDDMRKRILQGWPFTAEELERILEYCASDVLALGQLLPKMLPSIELDLALHRGEFTGVACAHMERRGVPIDMEIFPDLQEKRAWAFIRDAMVPMIDKQYGVYIKDKDGEWHFNIELFEAYLRREGINNWPRLKTGKLNLRRKTFENMTRNWPELEKLRQLRHARNKMRTIKLSVGADGRNRSTLWAFQSKTGRTQPKASQWIFSPAVWLRSLIKPGPGRAVAYLDYSAMEFQLAAVLSNCKPMLELYASGDPYLNFAKRVGAIPKTATKETHSEERDLYKVMLLATQYGMAAETLAARLGISTFAAREMLEQHFGLCTQYWRWSDDWVAHSLDTGVMRTPFGWTCCTGITEFNERSIRNWPIQSVGADILRIACIMAVRHGIELCAPVHDAVLIEAPIERIETDVKRMLEIMRRASRIVLNGKPDGPYELRADKTIVCYPDRYRDKRGEEVWTTVLDLLEQYREQSTRERERA